MPASCAGRRPSPIGADGRPYVPAAKERALWAAAEREEKALVARVRLYDDAPLHEYLTRIGARLVPEGVKAAGGPSFTFTVISDPTLNAFAMPDGHIYVHTGLLSRLDNEAQLATVLAHETVHVTHRHALGFTRHTGEAGLAARPAGGDERHRRRDLRGTVLSRTASVISGLGLELAATASMTGFGRDREGETDREGMRRLVAAGYDPKEAPRAFQVLAGDATDRGTLETFFLGTRARLEERVEGAQALLASVYAAEAARPDTIKNTDEFDLRMRPVVRENAQLDIRAGRFALARRQLDRVLAASPADPIAHVYYGDWYRLQAQRPERATEARELDAKALASYERAATLDPGYADPYRQLGLLYYGEKDTARAREAFQRYLALKPDAPDAARVRDYLVDLER